MAIRKVGNKWRVDVQPGGRGGVRIRRSFNDKETAKLFELRTSTPSGELEKVYISVCDLADRFNDFASIHFRGYKYERHKIKLIRDSFSPLNKRINEVQLSDGDAFVRQRQIDGLKPGSINREMNTLKRMFSWAVERGFLEVSPFLRLKHIKGAKSRTRWLDETEQNKFLETCKEVSPGLYAAVVLALETGFRLANVQQATHQDVKDGFITAKRTKSGKPYDVPVSRKLKDLLHTRGTHDNIVPHFDLRKKFMKACMRAALYRSSGDDNKVTFHTLRHTAAANWLRNGIPIYVVSKWMGHSSVQVTEEVYGHIAKTDHLALMETLNGRQSVDTAKAPHNQTA